MAAGGTMICSVDGCGARVECRGWCGKHYQRWLRHGDPLGGHQYRKHTDVCSVDDCGSPFYAKGYCVKHYSRWRAHGDATVVHVQSKSTCGVDGCDVDAHAKGMCSSHYSRFVKYGNPTTKGNPGRKRKAVVTNSGAHRRIQYDRGRASGQSCVDCGEAAQEWSYVGGDPNEMSETFITRSGGTTTVRYSGNPNYYVPRCVPCHRAFDGSNDALNRDQVAS